MPLNGMLTSELTGDGTSTTVTLDGLPGVYTRAVLSVASVNEPPLMPVFFSYSTRQPDGTITTTDFTGFNTNFAMSNLVRLEWGILWAGHGVARCQLFYWG